LTSITSLQNPHVKDAVKLRDHRGRQSQRRILIDGARELTRAVEAGVRLRAAFVCPALCESTDAQRVLTLLPGTGAEVFDVPRAVFEKLAFGQRAEGVLGVADTPGSELARLDAIVFQTRAGKPPMAPLVAVLEGVEKPGNVGAVLRSADGAGVSALIVADGGTDLYNPNAIRASLGTIFTVPVAAASTAETLAWLRAKGLAIYAARVGGAAPYTEVDYRRPAAIVLGSEARGLSAAWSAEDITAIGLPMLGVADSLNVSATAAVLFYEARRQRASRVGQAKRAPP
jgi:RNA methyltransferase, TrmH family